MPRELVVQVPDAGNVAVAPQLAPRGRREFRRTLRRRADFGQREVLRRVEIPVLLRQRVPGSGRLPVRDAPGRGVFVVPVADVQDFAHRLGPVPVRLELLGDGDRVGRGLPEVRAEIVDPEGRRTQAGHQRVARRRTDGLVAECALEEHAVRGEPVDARRLCARVAVAAEERLEIVDADQQHIRPLCGRVGRARRRGKAAERDGCEAQGSDAGRSVHGAGLRDGDDPAFAVHAAQTLRFPPIRIKPRDRS